MSSEYTKSIQEYVEEEVDIFSGLDFTAYDGTPETVIKLKEMFIRHFYFYEIGSETLSIFKYRLFEKWLLVIDYYNKLWKANEQEVVVLSSFTINNDTLTKLKDLPISSYDETDFATALQTVTNTSTGKNSPDIDLITSYIKQVKNINMKFLGEFDNLFMQIF